MSKFLEIITEPNKILRKVSEDVKVSDICTPEFQSFLADMECTMIKGDGVGLAAPQIGKNVRVVVIGFGGEKYFIINPEIVKKSWARDWDQEGCLSVPKTFGDVQRHKSIKCAYYNEKGKKVKISVRGYLARIFQHEIDHLDGVLFIDKAKDIKKVDD